MHTLRQAVRGLARRPGLSVLVIVIMALSIGGVTSTFSAAMAILFQELPYRDAGRMVVLSLVSRVDGGDNQLSYLEIGDWRRRSSTLSDLVPYMDWQNRVLASGDVAERIQVHYSAPPYLEMLGARPALGRLFLPQEDGAPRSAPVIILSHELWARSFAHCRRRGGRDPRAGPPRHGDRADDRSALRVAPAGRRRWMVARGRTSPLGLGAAARPPTAPSCRWSYGRRARCAGGRSVTGQAEVCSLSRPAVSAVVQGNLIPALSPASRMDL